MKIKNKFLFWTAFLSLLCIALMFQITFGQKGIKYTVTPYIFLPVLIFFFLHNKAFFSIGLCLFLGTLSSAFSPLSAPILIFLFLSLFLFILFIKQIFFYKSTLLFFALVSFFSLLLPSFSRMAYEFSKNHFFFPDEISFLKTLTTLILSLILLPFLKKYLIKTESF